MLSSWDIVCIVSLILACWSHQWVAGGEGVNPTCALLKRWLGSESVRKGYLEEMFRAIYKDITGKTPGGPDYVQREFW